MISPRAAAWPAPGQRSIDIIYLFVWKLVQTYLQPNIALEPRERSLARSDVGMSKVSHTLFVKIDGSLTIILYVGVWVDANGRLPTEFAHYSPSVAGQFSDAIVSSCSYVILTNPNDLLLPSVQPYTASTTSYEPPTTSIRWGDQARHTLFNIFTILSIDLHCCPNVYYLSNYAERMYTRECTMTCQ